MYGGIDRSAVSELKSADEQFIADVSQRFGGRENASKVWVEQGFRFYQRDDLVNAMRRFDQAWLLNPQNAEVFHGFASVLYDKSNNCSAMRMSERALALGLATADFLADAAMLHSLCGVDAAQPSDLDKATLIRTSDELFNSAPEKVPRNPYVFDKWRQALFWRRDYEEACTRVFAMRAAGGRPHELFLQALKQKMPEPR